MKTTFSRLIAISLVLIFTFTSCRKRNEELNDTTSETDSEQAESLSDAASNIADNAAKLGNDGALRTSGPEEIYDGLSGCATVTHDTVANPHILTIDYGTTNCLCLDGRYRRGKIIVSYTGKYFESGSVRVMTFDNYYQNDNRLEGTRTITNNGNDANGRLNWTINAQNMKITKSDGRTHTWNSTRTRTLLSDNSTSTWKDDVYEISGSAEGTNAKGLHYTAVITLPLHRDLSCRWIDKGTIKITPDGKETRTLDFGNGACDDQATVTVRNKTRNITLH